MSLFSIFSDSDNFRRILFNREQMYEEYGEDLPTHFDVNFVSRPYASIMKNPFKVNFADDKSGLYGSSIPDIAEDHGRLFLSVKAFDLLKELLQNDGEFLPVIYEKGEAYIFNPIHTAENVDGLDMKLSVKNEWGDIENIAFHEDRVKGFVIFKTEYDNYMSSYCQASLKEAVENSDLKGVFFTPDLGNPFSTKQAKQLQND